MNTQNIRNGVIGGLVGGMVFGMMMAMMGMLPMVGKLVGVPNALAGWVVHLGISAAIGASFAVIFGRSVISIGGGLVRGALYGSVWWVLGPLTLMPLMLGMGLGANWNLAAATNFLPSLMGHMIFGAVLGASYARLALGGGRRQSVATSTSRVL